MTDRYQVIREALPALIAEAQAKGGRNERAALIVELLEERDALQAEVEWLRAEVAALNAQIAELEEENAELEEENADLEAQTAPQSAPAGEREAFEAWWPTGRKTIDKANGLSMFKAGAAWQRTQSAGVPEDLRAAMLAVIDRSDWRTAANRAELRALLAAAPAKPAAQDQGEVQRLRDALRVENEQLREVLDELMGALQAIVDEVSDGRIPYSSDSYLPAHLVEQARAAIAAALAKVGAA